MLGGTVYLVGCTPSFRQRLISSGSSLLWGVLLSTEDKRVEDLTIIDCHFVKIGIDLAKVDHLKSQFTAAMSSHLYGFSEHNTTYKRAAEVVGDEATALRIFGLGYALGFWSVLTPTDFGVEPVLAEEAAELGMVSIARHDDSVRVLAVG
jgi:hypothetical protein